MKVISNFPRRPITAGEDYFRQSQENEKRLTEQDQRAKEAGTLVGRYISEPFADGQAVYVIVQEHAQTVRIEVCTGLGDDWVIPYWGPKATIDKAYAVKNLARRDGLAELFGVRDRKDDADASEQAPPIRKGDRIRIKPEWRDPGDEEIDYIALHDEDGGRVCIEAQLGLPMNPNHIVTTDMVEREPSSEQAVTKIDIVCSRCGGKDVRRDADAAWNVKTQQWELCTVYDKPSTCQQCGGETSLKEVPYSPEDIP